VARYHPIRGCLVYGRRGRNGHGPGNDTTHWRTQNDHQYRGYDPVPDRLLDVHSLTFICCTTAAGVLQACVFTERLLQTSLKFILIEQSHKMMKYA